MWARNASYCEQHKPQSHHGPALNRPCKHPDCPSFALYHHSYCADHATSINYAKPGGAKAPATKRTCSCGRTFTRRNRTTARTETEIAWDEFCHDCQSDSPLNLERLRAHHVPPELVREWLKLGRQLSCRICGVRFYHQAPHIDHDHDHCKGGTSCGKCIRGVLCSKHNTLAGKIQALMRNGQLIPMLEYLGSPPGVGVGVGVGGTPGGGVSRDSDASVETARGETPPARF